MWHDAEQPRERWTFPISILLVDAIFAVLNHGITRCMILHGCPVFIYLSKNPI
jgi:hypothetical protein